MALLWTCSEERRWRRLPLETEPIRLPDDLACAAARKPETAPKGPAALLARTRAFGREDWVLIESIGDRVRVDGLPIPGGIRVLSDREEILIDGGMRLFYSTDSIPRIQPFDREEGSLTCPRCTRRIKTGDASVRCPACGVWHHQTEEYPCWLYSTSCAACSAATSLDGGGCWTPEGL